MSIGRGGRTWIGVRKVDVQTHLQLGEETVSSGSCSFLWFFRFSRKKRKGEVGKLKMRPRRRRKNHLAIHMHFIFFVFQWFWWGVVFFGSNQTFLFSGKKAGDEGLQITEPLEGQRLH